MTKKKGLECSETSLHDKLEELFKELRDVTNKILRSNVRLSDKEHRGNQCRICKKPTANSLAQEELINEGDGPDLCWGDCT